MVNLIIKLHLLFLFTVFFVILTVLNFSNANTSYIIQKSYGQNIINDNNHSNNDIGNIHSMNFKFSSLTNNSTDSVYPRVDAFGNKVFVVWQQLVSPVSSMVNASNNNNSSSFVANGSNYDIFIKKSIDGGVTFDKAINLSNNSGFSEHPHLAVYGNNVYVTWLDNDTSTNKKKEIFFTKSSDGGQTFSNVIHLDRFANNSDIDSNNNNNNSKLGNSNNPEISAFGNKVYVVWNQEPQNYDNNNGNDTNPFVYKILFRASDDGGSTFKSIKTLSTNATYFSYPKITDAASSSISNKSNVYIVWNVGFPIDDPYKKVEGIFFTKSSDGGDNFDTISKISGPIKSIGKPQITSYGNNIYVVWAGIPDFRIGGNIFYTKGVDSDSYISFTNPISLSNNKSINVDVAVNKDAIYVVGEGLYSDTNDDIFIIKGKDDNSNQSFIKNAINLSNNRGLSECPSISLSDNNSNNGIYYIVWEDSTPGKHEIFFIRGQG